MDQKGTAENPGIAIQLSGGALTPSLGPPGDAAVPTDEPSKGPITPRALISNTMTYKTKRYVSSIEARAVLELACQGGQQEPLKLCIVPSVIPSRSK